MRPILHQLESNEAVLQMYLAGELSPTEQQAVDARLAADPTLRAQLDRLRQMQTGFDQVMAQLDSAQPIADSGSAMQRRIGRHMRQWQIDRVKESAAGASAAPRKPRWWLYNTAAAVLLVVGYAAWWGFQPAVNPTIAQQPPEPVEFFPDQGPRFDPLQDFTALATAEQELDELADLRTTMQ